MITPRIAGTPERLGVNRRGAGLKRSAFVSRSVTHGGGDAARTGSRVELAGALAAPELPPITQNA